MKKRIITSFLESRSMIFGLTIAYFIWVLLMWLHSSPWSFHRDLFAATLLLTAASGLVANRLWSNLLSAILSSQLPFDLLTEIWMLALMAETPIGSSQHVEVWINVNMDLGRGQMLWHVLSMTILIYAVLSIIRSSASCKLSRDV